MLQPQSNSTNSVECAYGDRYIHIIICGPYLWFRTLTTDFAIVWVINIVSQASGIYDTYVCIQTRQCSERRPADFIPRCWTPRNLDGSEQPTLSVTGCESPGVYRWASSSFMPYMAVVIQWLTRVNVRKSCFLYTVFPLNINIQGEDKIFNAFYGYYFS